MKTVRLFIVALLLMSPWSLAAQEESPVPAEDAAVQVEAAPAEAAPKAEAEPEESLAAEGSLAAEPEPAPGKAESEPIPESQSGIIYPADRPAWVDAPPVKEGEVDRIAVSSGPHATAGEARRQLEEAVKQAAADYVNRHLGAGNAAHFISYDVTRKDVYKEQVEFSFGPMHQAHVMLEFNPQFRDHIEREWKEALTLSRLLKTGLGSAAVFLLLSVVLGYFRADTATRGYYTRRLRFGAATAILALAAAIYFAVRYIPWMI
jgi:hypothetical protein